MTILDGERYLINKRIKEIIRNKMYAGTNRKIVIAGNTPVLEDDAIEFKSLKAMLEILDNNLKQTGQNDYIMHRKNTSLPKMPKKLETIFENPIYQRENEIKAIETRIRNYQAKYVSRQQSNNFPTSDGHYVKTADEQREYEALLKMKTIAANNFKSQNYYEYLDLREQTQLGTMDLTQYQILIGQPAPQKRNTKLKKRDNIQAEEPELSTNKNAELADIRTTTQVTKDNASSTKNVESQNEEDDLVEVVKITPWNWIKKHKKEILIALGLTALTITVVVFIAQVLPALTAADALTASASQLTQVANLANQAVANGNLWHTATTAEQFALHNANSGLMNIISNFTGLKTTYESASGIWSIGTQTITSFANTSTIAATKATEIAASATNSAIAMRNIIGATGIAGIAATTLGLLTSKKSDEYYTLKKRIDEFKKVVDTIDENEKAHRIELLSGQIISSEDISEKERKILLKKLQKAIKTYKMSHRNETNITEETPHVKAEMIGIEQSKVDLNNIITVDYHDGNEKLSL